MRRGAPGGADTARRGRRGRRGAPVRRIARRRRGRPRGRRGCRTGGPAHEGRRRRGGTGRGAEGTHRCPTWSRSAKASRQTGQHCSGLLPATVTAPCCPPIARSSARRSTACHSDSERRGAGEGTRPRCCASESTGARAGASRTRGAPHPVQAAAPGALGGAVQPARSQSHAPTSWSRSLEPEIAPPDGTGEGAAALRRSPDTSEVERRRPVSREATRRPTHGAAQMVHANASPALEAPHEHVQIVVNDCRTASRADMTTGSGSLGAETANVGGAAVLALVCEPPPARGFCRANMLTRSGGGAFFFGSLRCRAGGAVPSTVRAMWSWRATASRIELAAPVRALFDAFVRCI